MGRKKITKKDLTAEELWHIREEAAQRYTDTSWNIYRQSQKRKENETDILANSSNCDPDQSDRQSNESETKQSQNENQNENQKRAHQNDPVDLLYEPINKNVQIESHSHDELHRDGTQTSKMLKSSSYNGYGDALTSQPRSSRTTNNVAGTMDLSYVTERIISMWFPSSTTSHSYRQGQRQAAHMLRNKHGDNYMVFNLSEPKRALRNEHKFVKEVGWTPNLAPPLERLCSVCKDIDSWLSKDQHRIAVLHSRGSKDKVGIIVAAYMHYSSICGTAEQALDRFSMKKFLDDNVGPLKLPSNKRYVDYFAGLLSRSIKMNAASLYLTHVTVVGAPAFKNGGCQAFLKLYEGHNPVYTSGVYSVSNGISQFTVNIATVERKQGLELRGDILIKCYHRGYGNQRETIFACQFHTCAVADNTLSFTRQELDIACNDSRFPVDGAVQLHFSSGPDARYPVPAPTPAVPYTSLNDDPVVRANSPFNGQEFDDDEDSDSDDVNHTFGPLDGSIYATIAKKPDIPGAVSSPLTVSMDSGISSAGHQQNANTTASGSPPPTAQPSPLTPEDQHRELDELLSDMMLTVQSIPDVKPIVCGVVGGVGAAGATQDFTLDNVRFIDEEDDKHNPYKRDYQREEEKESIPYHARENSKPFSYGINQDMIGESKGLSSPSLVRKASVNKSHGDTLAKVQTGVYPTSKPMPNFQNDNVSTNYYPPYSTLNKYAYSSTPNRTPQGHDEIDNIFTQRALDVQPIKTEFREEYYKDERRRYDPLKRSYTDGTLRRSPEKVGFKSSSTATSPYSDSDSLSPPGQFRNNTKSPEFHENYANGNLTWLQRQQQKLKERKEMRLKEERQPHETRLFSELKQVQTRHMKPTASHRLDGYTSDTTAFADDDDDFTVPLHINTMQRNGLSTPSSSQYSTLKSTYSTVTRNERPFMAVKKAHEKHSQYEQSSYTWRTQSTGTDADTSPSHSSSPRPQTPAFPVLARTTYLNASTPSVQFEQSERLPPKSPTTQRKDRPTSPTDLNGTSDGEYRHGTAQRSVSATGYLERNGSSSPTIYFGHSRRGSVASSANEQSPQEVPAAHVKTVRDTSKFWYKPSISREEAITMLRDQPAGTFVVRDSNSFPGAFGLALRVSAVPPNFQNKTTGSDELIRHFLIEPTSKGVRIKGCPNEPVFSSLSALIYQHSITQIALPCRLVLPDADLKCDIRNYPQAQMQQQLQLQGAACNVYYLITLEMESLTGPQAVKKAVLQLLQGAPPQETIVHFKVNGQGITLTDNKRKLFFRKHYPINTISHCGIDPEEHNWFVSADDEQAAKVAKRIFGFVARKPNVSNPDNQCHLFAELDPDQPANAIVNFVNKVLASNGIKPNIV
ncbi:focal adhesion protein tensin isoform X25 [Rhynchophorus ferrugineus]|uniref:focal adhesion protein tensin isoform X25 n=1 Tax=Rhynchophorus ferrugineus TaxID=354439 RepID=UPI003FCCC0E9